MLSLMPFILLESMRMDRRCTMSWAISAAIIAFYTRKGLELVMKSHNYFISRNSQFIHNSCKAIQFISKTILNILSDHHLNISHLKHDWFLVFTLSHYKLRKLILPFSFKKPRKLLFRLETLDPWLQLGPL